MSKSEGVFPTVWHRMLSAGVLQTRHPLMSMATLGWPFLYTLFSSVALYGIGLVIVVTDPTGNVSRALASALFAIVGIVTCYVATAYVLKLLFMPLNVELDPLTMLMDLLDTWFALNNGLTGLAMLIFVWSPGEFGPTIGTDPTYRAWLRLLFTETHDFHSAGFGITQVSGDWARVLFIAISYAGRLMLVMGLAALARLMSRNLKRFPKRYAVSVDNFTSSRIRGKMSPTHGGTNVSGGRVHASTRKRTARRGQMRGPTTTTIMETPQGTYELLTTTLKTPLPKAPSVATTGRKYK